MDSYTIDPSGTLKNFTPSNNKDFSLDELKEAIGGGHIEVVDLVDNYMVVDEEGKLKNFEYNPAATSMFKKVHGQTDYIVGKVLICKKNQIL